MMRFDVLTIFPSLFDSFLNESLLEKAISKGIVDLKLHDIRKWSENKHRKVDDEPFGGGAGMVMTPQPIADAIEELKKEKPAVTKTILMSPRGKPFTQKKAKELAACERLILVCGRYEGVDERISQNYVDEEISIGDFVINGGEVAAMAVVEAVFRLLPGAIGSPESLERESFDDSLLEAAQYTRPENFRGEMVPKVLLSGHHKNIEKWRLENSREKTRNVRPDLLAKGRVKPEKVKYSLALVHHPVADKAGNEMVSSITSIDVHDFARLGKTYGASKVYIVTPVEDQFRLVERIRGYWSEIEGLREIDPKRGAALGLIEVVSSVDEIIEKCHKNGSKKVKLLATSARESETISAPEWHERTGEADEWIILFGTSYGLGKSLMEKADYCLAPICGPTDFNHLPVRGASAIIINSLFGIDRS